MMPSPTTETIPARPLAGMRVLELGQLLAGPFAGSILGYFGAEVIKVEPPGKGDALRVWRLLDHGTSLWWRSLGRNKKCITLNLHTDKGRALTRQLADHVVKLRERTGARDPLFVDERIRDAQRDVAPQRVVQQIGYVRIVHARAGRKGPLEHLERFSR